MSKQQNAIETQCESGYWADLVTGDNPPLTKSQAVFLAAYEQLGNISAAAKAAKVSVNVHYKAKGNETYQKLFDHAKRTFVEQLETEATRRAVEGVEEPIYHAGKMVGTRKRYSDVLLIFMMKAHNPEKYGDKRETPGTYNQQVNITIRDMTPDKRQERLRYLAERAGLELGVRSRN